MRYIAAIIALLAPFLIVCSSGVVRADTVIEWAPDKDGPRKTYTIDGVGLTISEAENEKKESPRLDARSPQGEVVTLFGAGRFIKSIPVKLRITRLDPTNSEVDVMFGVFTGGAHCCTEIKILSLVGDKWEIVDLGNWDGDNMPEPEDWLRNGEVTLTFYDNSFLYAFDTYASSFAPLKILRIFKGKEIDVSRDLRLAELHRRNLDDARKLCAEHQNGGCAAYVASAARLGVFPEAWGFMLKNYDRQNNWKLEFCETPGVNRCNRMISFPSFPNALAWFLQKHGYVSIEQLRAVR